MKTIEYRFVNKSQWGEGPWTAEPDKIQWMDEATGFPCLIVRGPHGSWCGYVGVSEGHPSFGKEYHTVDVDVHGGLSFSNFCHPEKHEHGICHTVEDGEDDHVFWLGFDCAHAWDSSPAQNSRLKSLGIDPRWRDDMETYRDVEYVKDECRRLAAQLKAICVPAG